MAVVISGLSVVFQPVVSLGNGCVEGYEALCRGVGDPWEYFAALSAAEAREADAKVCRLAAAAFSQARPGGLLFVNLMLPSFLDSGLAMEALSGLPAGSVVVEVTERACRVEPGEMARAAEGWRAGGFRLAVDDVGSGQSRLLAVAEIEPDFVKVERPLLQRALMGGAGRGVVLCLVSLARSLGMRAVAEGIETPEELTLVRGLGFDLAQGYLFGRPGVLRAEFCLSAG